MGRGDWPLANRSWMPCALISGSPLGPMRARDGNVHRGRPEEGLLPMISHLGAMISVVNGTVVRRSLQRHHRNGRRRVHRRWRDFHRRLSRGAESGRGRKTAAGCWSWPTIITPIPPPTHASSPAARCLDRAGGYGVEGHSVDGTDLEACLESGRRRRSNERAPVAARKWSWPNCCAFAVMASTTTPATWITKLKVLAGRARLPEGSLKKKLRRLQLGRCGRRIGVHGATEAVQEVEEAVATVQREPGPDPFKENWCALASKHLSEGQ